MGRIGLLIAVIVVAANVSDNTGDVAATVVNRIHPDAFVALPKRWIVERTRSWLMNNRRLQVDYEREPYRHGRVHMGRPQPLPPPPTHPTRPG